MRRGFGILGLVVTLLVIAAVGAIAYQVGWSDGVAQHLPAATDGGSTAVAPYPYYYGWYGGGPRFFHFRWVFRLPFFPFFVFLFSRIVALGLCGGGRRGGGGYGRGWGMYGGQGGTPPAIDERMKDWHRQAHGEAPAQGTTPSTPPPPPVPDK